MGAMDKITHMFAFLLRQRHISERPAAVGRKRRVGDWEADLVHGTQDDSRHCLLTIVDRLTNYVVIWTLTAPRRQQRQKRDK